ELLTHQAEGQIVESVTAVALRKAHAGQPDGGELGEYRGVVTAFAVVGRNDGRELLGAEIPHRRDELLLVRRQRQVEHRSKASASGWVKGSLSAKAPAWGSASGRWARRGQSPGCAIRQRGPRAPLASCAAAVAGSRHRSAAAGGCHRPSRCSPRLIWLRLSST